MNIYKGHLTTLLLIEITEIEIDTAFFTFLFIPYQALKCLMKFKVHTEGVALDAHIRWQRAEVRLERAVWTTRNGDVLALVDARVALRRPGQHLNKGVVRIAAAEFVDVGTMIAAQHALIVLTGLQRAVAVKNGLHVTAEFCTTVPTLKHVFHDASHEANLL